MKINPMSEKEARDAATPPPLPAGDYDCEIAVAVETVSKSSGMGMFEIDLRVFTDDGRTRTVRDYVMTEGKAAWRLRQCCVGLGLLAQYDAGEVGSYDFEGRSGRVSLIVEEDKNGLYPPKNRVKAYIVPGTPRPLQSAKPRQPVSAGHDLDDEIPF